MGEPVESVDTVASDAKPKDNWVDLGTCQQADDAFNDLSSPLSGDPLGIKSAATSITDTAGIDDKPITNIKKKNKKKTKKNKKPSGNTFAWAGPVESDPNTRSSSYHLFNVDRTTIKCHKNSQSFYPADITSVCLCETSGGCLKDAANYDGKLISVCCCGPFEVRGNHVHSGSRSIKDDKFGFSGRGLNANMQEAEDIYALDPNIINYQFKCTKDLKEIGDLSQYKFCGTERIISSASESCNGGGTDKSHHNCQNTSFRKAHAAHPAHDTIVSHSDLDYETRCPDNSQTGKENCHSVWQKSKKHNRAALNHPVKTSNRIYVEKGTNLVERSFEVKYNSFYSNGLLPTPIVSSSGHHVFSHDMLKNKHRSYHKSHRNIHVESPQWVAQQRCHSNTQVDSELRHDGAVWNKELGKLKEKRSSLHKHENLSTNKKRFGDYKANWLRFQNRAALSQKEAFDVPEQPRQCSNQDFAQRTTYHQTVLDDSHCSHSYTTSDRLQLNLPLTTMSSVLDYPFLDRVLPYTSVKIPWTEHVSVESLNASLDKIQRNTFGSDMKISYEDNTRQDFNSQVSSQKWIPVGRKDSEVLKNIETVYTCNNREDVLKPCKIKDDVDLEEYIVPVSAPSVGPEKTCLVSRHDMSKEATMEIEMLQLNSVCKNTEHNFRKDRPRDYISASTKGNDTDLLSIGSEMAVKALNASYQLQILSESIQQATGSPLAEFEKLLQSASPVIAAAPSVLLQCRACLGNPHPFSSLCKHQLANISLRDVWSWYEKPGNYGLEVRAEDTKTLKGMNINSLSFNAHFVPFLSAIQLFGHSQKSRHSESVVHLSPEFSKNGEAENNYFHVEESIDELASSPGIISADGRDFSGLSSAPSCSNDMNLIFEFFESEQPQQRKPLYAKVREIVKVGTSNHQVFGDPSGLQCMQLHNIHPASWYSVAWYPIYRIPEGNFRASFLTYHSLGHLVQRCIAEPLKGSQYCVISPVLGLQSYNAQGECWFYPKVPTESFSKIITPFSSSEVLKERLRTLEENALLFARGCVDKGHAKVTNRQPDYEFFLSRKR
ncbi:hypothetical protein IFM89_033886 [Coptis chinensis]|uniref:Uncharacterized protein n=1 Tax=Coptis chinensis TaxID=261450 RepID=A0A835GZC5_9MAGN|nr:hypothetical protein IFM89_033886 [Coptis chinensis]